MFKTYHAKIKALSFQKILMKCHFFNENTLHFIKMVQNTARRKQKQGFRIRSQMKTMIEVQFNGNNVTDKDLDKYVKETLKADGIKTTDIDTLNIYYVPESAKLFYVANKKDGAEVSGELAIADMPDYSVVACKPAAKKAPAKKAAPKKAPAKAATVAKETAKPAAKKTVKKQLGEGR